MLEKIFRNRNSINGLILPEIKDEEGKKRRRLELYSGGLYTLAFLDLISTSFYHAYRLDNFSGKLFIAGLASSAVLYITGKCVNPDIPASSYTANPSNDNEEGYDPTSFMRGR